MTKLITLQNPDDEKPLALSRLADTQKSESHVDQLLAIGNHALQLLIEPDKIGESVTVDEDAKKAARDTFLLAHIKLRDLIDEQKRWSLSPGEAEVRMDKLMDSTEGLYNQKTTNAKIFNRPSVFLRAQVKKFTVGWIAWVGGDVPTVDSLHGIGASPALAMKAFDDYYYDVQALADKNPPIEPEIVAKIRKTPRKKNA